MSAEHSPAPFDAVSPGAVPPNSPIPRHIAIVMDGNGRWAERRGLPRPEGHIRGSAIVSPLVEEAARLGVERLTLYCFSSENWKRPQTELDALMGLLKAYMIEQRPTLEAQNVRLRVVGRRAGIPADVLAEMDKTVELSAANTGLTLALAINYGSRLEIVDAVKAIVAELSDPAARAAALEKAGVSTVDELIDERYFASRLYEPDAPDPDLLIRTGGEMRLSNYLLWQLSYSELWVSDVLWPDFTRETLWNAIRAFQKRKRRFGGLNAPEKADGVL
ncbi:MAG: di-trans,poly-cis-decaprenylcistransferase [Thermoguttaceae bacterium]|nr:di-trans,poly-cis-decaprenylcistransferase [Thermoguttaceae bacterium]